MTVIHWCLANWDVVLGAALALLSLLNAATGHYDSASGMRRLLLVALDWVSALRSGDSARSDSTPRGLQLKMPLLQLSPPQDRVAARIAGVKKP